MICRATWSLASRSCWQPLIGGYTPHTRIQGRKGCPGKSVLTALALAKEKFEDEYTLTHIGHCAACLDDLKQIKRELTEAGSSR